MQASINPTKDFDIKGKYIFFDSDVLIDTVKLDLIDDIKNQFKSSTKCVISSTKLEVLNTKNPRDFTFMSEFLKGFWPIPLTNNDFIISETLQNYNVRLNKCPSIGDYYIASKLISFGSRDVYILTGNVQDFSGEIFDCVNTYDVFKNGCRKIWCLIGKNKRFNSVKKVLENI